MAKNTSTTTEKGNKMENATEVQKLEAELTKNADSIAKIESRLISADKDQEAEKGKYDSLRLERQSALALNLNIRDKDNYARINTGLKESQEKLDHHFDMVTGLNNELTRLTVEQKKLSDNLAIAGIQQFTEELKTLSQIYNKQAEELAQTVKAIFKVRLQLKEDSNYSRVLVAYPGWLRNALETIPKLFIAGEPQPSLVTEQSFFDATFNNK